MAKSKKLNKKSKQSKVLSKAIVEVVDPKDIKFTKKYTPRHVQQWTRTSFGWNEELIRSACQRQSCGDFQKISQLAKSMMLDATYSAAINLRALTLIQRELRLLPPEEHFQDVADALETILWMNFPEQTQKEIITSFLNTGVAFAQIFYENKNGLEYPTLDVWDTENLRYNQTSCQWEVFTKDSGIVEIHPGDGQWFMMTTWKPGFNSGFAASLGNTWCDKQFGRKDRQEGNAAQIDNIAVIQEINDGGLNDEQIDVDALATEIRTQKANRVLYLDKNKTVTFTPSVTSYNSTGVDNTIQDSRTEMQIAILGGNLISEINKNGSYSATESQLKQLYNLIRSDSKIFGESLRQHVLMFIAERIFGFSDEITPYLEWDLTIENVDELTKQADLLIKLSAFAKQEGYKITSLAEQFEKLGLQVEQIKSPEIVN